MQLLNYFRTVYLNDIVTRGLCAEHALGLHRLNSLPKISC